MLSSITPLGERGRGRRWGVTVTAYLTGSTLGGAAAGAVLGRLGALVAAVAGGWPAPAVTGAVAAVCLAGAAADAAARGARIPSWHRQVDEDWLARYRGWVYGLGYGFQLGLGVVTIVTTAAVYVVLAVAVATASVAAGALVGATFGLARALPVLGVARVHRVAELRALHRTVERWSPAARRTAVLAQTLAAAALAAGAVVTATGGTA